MNTISFNVDQAITRLSQVLGDAQAEAVFGACLREIGISAVDSAADLIALASAMNARGGIIAVIGRSLKAAALTASAAQRPQPLSVDISAGKTDPSAVASQVKQLAVRLGFPSAAQTDIFRAVAALVTHVIHSGAAGGLRARPIPTGIRVEVWDHGPGIPPAEVERLKNPSSEQASPQTEALFAARQAMQEFHVLSSPGLTQVFMERHLR